MKILVTGGAGYIAAHTDVVLLEAGYDVVAVDNFVNSSYESIEKVEKITSRGTRPTMTTKYTVCHEVG